MAVSAFLGINLTTQNVLFLIIAVFVTVLVLALSTYYVFKYSFTRITAAHASESEGRLVQGTENQRNMSQAAPTGTGTASKDEVDAGLADHGEPAIDPVQYCEHIQGEIKKVKQDVTTRKICENLSSQQIAEERQRQRDQLAEIYNLMQAQQEKFGIGSMEEMQEQMRLYTNF